MILQQHSLSLLFTGLFLFLPLRVGAEEQGPGLAVQNGWYVQTGEG